MIGVTITWVVMGGMLVAIPASLSRPQVGTTTR
jgi:hypothetical protein